MGINEQQRKAVEGVFKAMQTGPGSEDAMIALFADGAVFIEPFSGQPQTHTGKDAIRESFRDQWRNPLPGLELTLDRVDLDGAHVRADWTCTSPVFPAPMRGYDLFTVNGDGKIARLEIIVTEFPPTDR
jgi:hypothetical protein